MNLTSPLVIFSLGMLAVLVTFLLLYVINANIIYNRYTGNLSQSATYEFRNKIKQPFYEQDT